jgi:hypothetical protein
MPARGPHPNDICHANALTLCTAAQPHSAYDAWTSLASNLTFPVISVEWTKMSQTSRILGPGAENCTSPDWLYRFRGRTVRAIVLAGFGAYSMYWWTVAAIPRGRLPWLAAIAVITAILVGWSVAQLTFLRRVPQAPLDEFARSRRKRFRRFYLLWFGLILTTEVAAIILAGPILGHFHWEGLFPQWVDGVVGFHFFPLAKLFRLPLYYATGVAILLAALGPLLISPGPLRDATTAGGTSLALWLTSFIILSRNLSCLPVNTGSGA